MKTFSLEHLASGIRERNVGAERTRLIEKWSRTGLLRGLDGYSREAMSQLLENQAAQVLKESNALSQGGGSLASSGQIQGFTSIAFPIVRRVFGGLVANELVSIQPMSLPSGLIFYIDYTYGNNVGGAGTAAANTYAKGQSIYNNPAGAGVRSGSLAAGGQYDLVGTGFSRVHSGSASVTGLSAASGSWGGALGTTFTVGAVVGQGDVVSGSTAVALGFDSQVLTDLSTGVVAGVVVAHVDLEGSNSAIFDKADKLAVDQMSVTAASAGTNLQAWGEKYQGGAGVLNLRRLNKRGRLTGSGASLAFVPDPLNGTVVQLVFRLSSGADLSAAGVFDTLTMSFVKSDTVEAAGGTGGTLTIPSFESDFGATPSPAIPEIDIKIESIAITATTRKLRARWSPELAQDLNAYHSLDAEVELTSILSEQIALEIDREILNDLLTQANGANLYWSRAPGKFVDKTTGGEVTLSSSLAAGPHFTGTVREWYETLVETIIDVANTIHRKTLRGSANFAVVGPDVATILESSVLYKPKFSIDGQGQVASPFTIGAEAIGTLSNRFTLYKDPYFPRNKILVGYKGGSYLETGYVYAPYVPLIVTPTIFAPEDFTPRKGVMTRYGKKMVRSDFYGTVTCLDMNVI